jgi:hypothetical protein
MAQQHAGTPIPPLPDGPRNDAGIPTGNPSGGYPDSPPMIDGEPVSPAVARPRAGAAAAHGHGDSGGPGR